MIFLALALALQSEPPQATSTTLETPPSYLARPGSALLERNYPRAALDHAVSGAAALRCTATPEGLLANCGVERESPAGWGFGEAALKSAPAFRLKPALKDGAPVEASVAIPLVFLTFAEVTLDCSVEEKDGARDCRVAREDPPGRGAAARALAEAAESRPSDYLLSQARKGRFRWTLDVPLYETECAREGSFMTCSGPVR